MKKVSFIYFLIVIFIVTSCGAGIGDYSEDLSGGYVYRVDGTMSYIMPNHIFNDGVYPNVIGYAFDDDYILVLQQPSEKHIRALLADDLRFRYLTLANVNDTAELSKREYNLFKENLIKDSVFYRMLTKELSPNNTAEDIQKSQKIANNIVDTSMYYQRIVKAQNNYWIISHIKEKQYGPFTREEYLMKVQELQVPERLLREFDNNIEME